MGGEEEKSISLGLEQLERLLDSLYLACEMDCSVSSVDAVVNCLSDSLDDFQRVRRWHCKNLLLTGRRHFF
eukprot:668876-Pelagomonas_calceolata.AAC.1